MNPHTNPGLSGTRIPLLFCIACALFISGCNDNVIYSEALELPSKEWEIGDVKEFNFQIEKPNLLYNVYLTFDLLEDFPTNNLHLHIKSTSPSGNSENDTIMYYVCDKTGKWLGERSGSVIHNKFLFKKQIKFVEKGNYSIKYEHLMREDNVPKIESAGLIIESVDQ